MFALAAILDGIYPGIERDRRALIGPLADIPQRHENISKQSFAEQFRCGANGERGGYLGCCERSRRWTAQ